MVIPLRPKAVGLILLLRLLTGLFGAFAYIIRLPSNLTALFFSFAYGLSCQRVYLFVPFSKLLNLLPLLRRHPFPLLLLVKRLLPLDTSLRFLLYWCQII